MAPLSFATAASKQPPPPCGPSCWQLATGMCSSNSGGDAATSGTRGAWAWQDRGGEGRRTLGDLIKRFRAIEVEGLGGVGQGQGQQVQQQQQQWPRRQSQGDGPHMVEDEGSQPVLQPQPLTPPLLLLPQQRQGLGGELQGVQGAEPEGMHIDAQTEEGPSQGSGACNSQGNAQGTGVAAHTETARGVPKWSDQELALLEKGRAMFGTYHPCGIALLLRPDSGSGGSGKAGGGQLTPQTTGMNGRAMACTARYACASSGLSACACGALRVTACEPRVVAHWLLSMECKQGVASRSCVDVTTLVVGPAAVMLTLFSSNT
eukprot:993025-Pelagomonas_calceolata.AAC.3